MLFSRESKKELQGTNKYKGVVFMGSYYGDMMFNPQYVNQAYYNQMQAQIAQYNFEQNTEVVKTIHAVRDLCQAIKKMDNQHQQEAFLASLAVMAQEFGWQ